MVVNDEKEKRKKKKTTISFSLLECLMVRKKLKLVYSTLIRIILESDSQWSEVLDY